MDIKTRSLGYAIAFSSIMILSALNPQFRHIVVADAFAGCGYDNRSWDELPYGVRRAWAMLGYSRNVWDSDRSTRSEGESWSQLTARQRQAAAALGYSPSSWDNDCGAAADID
ncbi:MAG: hypothetical protein JSR89_11420 [Proteobacteria bacterium]|nr:hypothetical protein [Pseudomonadota bacterium]